LDASGTISFCDFRVKEILGLDNSTLIGMNIDSLPFLGLTKDWNHALQHESFLYQHPVLNKSQKIFISSENHLNQDGTVQYRLLRLSESEYGLKESINQLLLNIERYELVAKATHDVIWDFNITNRQLEWIGEEIYDLLGYEKFPDNKMMISDFYHWCIRMIGIGCKMDNLPSFEISQI